MKQEEYTSPKVWTWDKENGGEWAGVNRPVAGATHEQELPVGDASLQLYSLGTPNGIKITVMLEELLALGKTDAAYDLHKIRIGKGEQFGSGFVALNPNSKIPVLLDLSKDPPQSVFESCAILHYLAEKFDALFRKTRANAPSACPGCSGRRAVRRFSAAASVIFISMRRTRWNTRSTVTPWKPSASSMCSTATWRKRDYICVSGYSVADIAIWSWYGRLALGDVYNAVEFLQANSYEHVLRWANAILGRDGVQRGLEAAR